MKTEMRKYSRRIHHRRVALAASILIPLAGTGGYAAFNMAKGNAARPTEADGSRPIPVATGRPVDRERPALFEAGPRRDASGRAHHVHTPAGPGGSGVPILPKDPLRPFAHFEWYHVVPSHVIDRKFDPETRELDLSLNQDVSPAAKLQAR